MDEISQKKMNDDFRDLIKNAAMVVELTIIEELENNPEQWEKFIEHLSECITTYGVKELQQ